MATSNRSGSNVKTLRLRCLAVVVTSFYLGSVAAVSATGIEVKQSAGQVQVIWPASSFEIGQAEFNLDETKPLIASLGIGKEGETVLPMLQGLNPAFLLTIGERDLTNPAGWVAFFDNPPLRPHKTFLATLGKRTVAVTESDARTTLSVAAIDAGSFHGDLRFTFYRNSALIHVEAVMTTEEQGRAILYDAGLTSATPDWKAVAWHDTTGHLQREGFIDAPAQNLKVAGRAVAVQGERGSVAAFPAPHQFFFPEDEAFNLDFVWRGKGYGGLVNDSGFGIRQAPSGDKRYVPWFNAPPGTEQHLGVFYLLNSGDAGGALDEVARYTHGDQFKSLPGYLTYTSHYHVEHTFEFLRRQREDKTNGVPPELEVPGFVKTFKARGVNIVHLAEFHAGDTPNLPDEKRLPLLKTLHAECQRLSDDQLLVLPGEEPNVHLGGHWLSLFPKPVYWVLNRPAGVPFERDDTEYGKVYHVGSAADVLQLMEREHGLMWTAHPRIKASIGFPDKYKDAMFFRSDHFLGAAWKAMPADLSLPRLGTRALDLLDDMSNWGSKKQLPGEADLFRMEPDFETYAHLNINYLKLDKLPRFSDGWEPVLDALRGGKFFTSTGEVLVPKFVVGGKESGETLDTPATGESVLEADVEWTFPLNYAEVISGDGKQVFRQRIDLDDTEGFGSRHLRVPLKLKGRKWVRLEVWDVAADGAYTEPVWVAGETKDAKEPAR